MNNIEAEKLVVAPVERKDGTYALRLCITHGRITAGMMKTVMKTMEEFNLPFLRSTTGQRMNLEGIPADRVDEVIASLGTAAGKIPPGVAACAGAGICKYGMQESGEMADRLLALIKQNGPYPSKVKSGVSGCKMACAHSFVRDIGMIGGPKGWDVHFGGSSRKDAVPGVKLGSGLGMDDALELVGKALVFYRENGNKRERSSAMLRRLGTEALLNALG
ncbi:nitrite reductase [Maridesulfovibrio sp.]|uniref:nitrite reductase n=1 Tax=Maridesulfovibrio sp. TaxID=2795000 RepID=UPI002A18D867|nr:nitrite reductase [Maridesulfovibrio sp.]